MEGTEIGKEKIKLHPQAIQYFFFFLKKATRISEFSSYRRQDKYNESVIVAFGGLYLVISWSIFLYASNKQLESEKIRKYTTLPSEQGGNSVMQCDMCW